MGVGGCECWKMLPRALFEWICHDWGHSSTIWDEIEIFRINFSRRMQPEYSRMPKSPYIARSAVCCVGLWIFGNFTKMSQKMIIRTWTKLRADWKWAWEWKGWGGASPQGCRKVPWGAQGVPGDPGDPKRGGSGFGEGGGGPWSMVSLLAL